MPATEMIKKESPAAELTNEKHLVEAAAHQKISVSAPTRSQELEPRLVEVSEPVAQHK